MTASIQRLQALEIWSEDVLSAEEVEIHILLLFFHNFFLLCSGSITSAATATSSCCCWGCTSTTTATKFEELVDILAIAHLRKESWEEGLNFAAGCLDELVDRILGDVKIGVLEDHRCISTEKLILLCLWHLSGCDL